MFLGIDVGGTHTDAVIIDQNGVVASAKVETCPENLIASIDAVLEKIFADGRDCAAIRRVNLSTTLTTNAIIEDKLEKVGILATAGPGLIAATFNYDLGEHFHLLPGVIDHRGSRQQDLDKNLVRKTITDLEEKGVKVFAVACKFSSRNPEFEEFLAEQAAPIADFVTIGHQVSGQLNFPRRLATAYYNAAVWRRYINFTNAVSTSFAKFKLKAPLNILKADGGTIDFTNSRSKPVETILSGPAASVMGISALTSINEDAIILDIGGTTTDIAIFAQGTPLLDKEGAAFANRKTSIRAIKTASIGIGGDSLVTINPAGGISVGPQRAGAPLAFSGPAATLIDLCNVKGLCNLGDRDRSYSGCKLLAEKLSLDIAELADTALQIALQTIQEKSFELLDKINQKPVYTVAEIIHGQKIVPQKLFVMGAPAQVLAPELAEIFQLETVVPENFAVANAVGAALTRPTMAAELFADTGKKRVFIPALDYKKEIDRNYSLAQAREDLIDALTEYLKVNHYIDQAVPEIEVISAEEFNMVGDYAIDSKSIRINCQIKPSLETDYLQGVKI